MCRLGSLGEESSDLHFYPAWEILPHESRLPHADVISERLETLVALQQPDTAPLIVTSVVALQQRTLAPGELKITHTNLRMRLPV
jgi:transcription-repair coupling factor (superfamily II helicase)